MYSKTELFANTDSDDDNSRQEEMENKVLRRTKSKTRRESAIFAAQRASVRAKIGVPGHGSSTFGPSGATAIRDRGELFNMGKMLALQVSKQRQPGSGSSVDHGIPVREGLIYMHKINRDKSVKEAILFFFFLLLFGVVVFLLYDVHEAFASNQAIEDLLLKEELPGTVYKKDFSEIMTQTEMWQWLEGPLANGIWRTTHYNGQLIPDNQTGYALDTLRVVGGVQLRQSRAESNSCGSFGRSDRSRTSGSVVSWAEAVMNGILWSGSMSAGLGLPHEDEDEDGDGSRFNGSVVLAAYSASYGAAGIAPPTSQMLPACLQRGIDSYTNLTACVSGYDSLDGLCVDEFLEGRTEEKRPFIRTGRLLGNAGGGPGLQLAGDTAASVRPQEAVVKGLPTVLGDGFYEVDDMTRVYTWQDGFSNQNGLFGYGPPYGTGGYSVTLPAGNRTEAMRRLAVLKQDQWTDRTTRALGVYVNLYNTATRKLIICRMLFEIFASGHVIKSSRFYTVPVAAYDQGLDRFRMALELLFAVYLLFYLGKQVRRVAYAPSFMSFLARFENLFEIAILSLAFLILGQWLRFVASPSIRAFDVNEPKFVDYFDAGEIFINVTSWAGILVLMLILKLFQYLAIDKRFNLLWLTLSRASIDIAAFAVTFFLVAGGFAFAGYNLFGHVLVDFKSFGFSFATLLRYALGMFSYEDLAQARPAVAGIFFTLYVGMVTLVVLSMVVAVLVRHYHAIIEEQRFFDRWLESALSFEASLALRVRASARESWYWCRTSLCSVCCRVERATLIASQDGSADTIESPGSVGGPAGGPSAGTGAVAGLPTSSVGAGGSLSGGATNAALDLGGTNEERERRTWQAEAHFLARLHKCMQLAKWTRSIDLFQHFEQVYQESGSNNFVYIGWDELVALTTKPGQTYNPPMTLHPELTATTLIQAYTAWKETMVVVGIGMEHERVEQEVNRLGLPPYQVYKVNRAGQRRRRILYIDTEKAQVLNFAGTKMTKRLPVTQLVQLEQTNRQPARLTLVFTSQGVPQDDEELMGAGGLETKFIIDFQSPNRKMQFMNELRKCRSEMMDRIHQLQQDLRDAGTAAVAANASSSDGSRAPKKTPAGGRKANRSIRVRKETERRATVAQGLGTASTVLRAAMTFRAGTRAPFHGSAQAPA